MKRAVALLFALCAASPVRADIGPPAGKKVVPVTTVVEATEAFPDYAFFEMSFSSTPGPPPHGGSSTSTTIHFFVPGTTIKATGDRRSGGKLYAVPRAVVENGIHWKGFADDAAKQNPPKYMRISGSDDGFARAHSVSKGEIPGAVKIRFGGSEEVPIADPRTAITENYRIVRTPAGVAFVNPDDSPAAPTSSGRAEGGPALDSPAFPWPWVIAGAAGFGSILLGGLWLVLRSRKA